jgi:hypothetical protein
VCAGGGRRRVARANRNLRARRRLRGEEGARCVRSRGAGAGGAERASGDGGGGSGGGGGGGDGDGDGDGDGGDGDGDAVCAGDEGWRGGRRRKRRDGWPTEANKVGHGVAYGKKTRQDWLARLGSRASQNGHRRAEHVRGGESSAGPYEAGQA